MLPAPDTSSPAPHPTKRGVRRLCSARSRGVAFLRAHRTPHMQRDGSRIARESVKVSYPLVRSLHPSSPTSCSTGTPQALCIQVWSLLLGCALAAYLSSRPSHAAPHDEPQGSRVPRALSIEKCLIHFYKVSKSALYILCCGFPHACCASLAVVRNRRAWKMRV